MGVDVPESADTRFGGGAGRPASPLGLAAALGSTGVLVTASVLGGAHIVRVHAVGPMVQVVRAAEEIRQAR